MSIYYYNIRLVGMKIRSRRKYRRRVGRGGDRWCDRLTDIILYNILLYCKKKQIYIYIKNTFIFFKCQKLTSEQYYSANFVRLLIEIYL